MIIVIPLSWLIGLAASLDYIFTTIDGGAAAGGADAN